MYNFLIMMDFKPKNHPVKWISILHNKPAVHDFVHVLIERGHPEDHMEEIAILLLIICHLNRSLEYKKVQNVLFLPIKFILSYLPPVCLCIGCKKELCGKVNNWHIMIEAESRGTVRGW